MNELTLKPNPLPLRHLPRPRASRHVISPFRWLKIGLVRLRWRNARLIAEHLLGFALTEEGSALDMLRAAERESDPKRKRLFFRHSVDEARHAKMFALAARAIDRTAKAAPYASEHAKPQRLFESMPLDEFLVFVHDAESEALEKFDLLLEVFPNHPILSPLLRAIARDERFHARYSAHLLEKVQLSRGASAVRNARLRVKMRAAWATWRRAGRQLGDRLSNLLLSTFYFFALVLFLPFRRSALPSAGWKAASPTPKSRAALKEQA